MSSDEFEQRDLFIQENLRPENNFKDLIEVLRPSSALEIGSWRGRSAITFLFYSRKLGDKLKLTCVDTWLGSVEHWANSYPDSEWSYEQLGVVRGQPTLLDVFFENIDRAGFSENVEIIRASSACAFVHLVATGRSGEFDFVYVDGDHSMRAVTEDLKGAQSILAQSGSIAGDDFNWPDVCRAVLKFRRKSNKRVLLSGDGISYVLLPLDSGELAARFSERGWRRLEGGLLLKIWIELIYRNVLRLSRRVKA